MKNREDIFKLTEKLVREAFEIASSNISPLSDNQRLKISLKLLSAVSNLYMGDALKQEKLFKEAEKIDIHILRPHYYSPLPTLSQLPENIWGKQEDSGISWNEKIGLSLLENLTKYADEYKQILDSGQFNPENNAFVHHDPAVYYAIIRHFKPKKVIEVGGGFSTIIASLACKQNGNTDLTCVEPYPPQFLENDFPGLMKLNKKPVQEIPLSTFQELGKNDILFIDSSHVSKVGSDVNYLFLYVLPNLNPGVLIHVHDIFLPKPMPLEWTKERHLFWNEQYLLHAFLIGNYDFEVLLGIGYMAIFHPESLKKLYDHEPVIGGSFWMRKTK